MLLRIAGGGWLAVSVPILGLASTPFPVPPPSSYAPLPQALTSFGAVTHHGQVYVVGGHLGKRHDYSAQDASASCWRLDLAKGLAWEALPDDVPAQSPALVSHGAHLYRIGGMAARNDPDQPQDLHSHASVTRLDVASGTWSGFIPLPEARSSHDAVVVGNMICVAGGWTLSGGSSNAVWRDTALLLDLAAADPKWRSVPQPFRRRGLAMAALDGKVYCLGGMDEDEATSLEVDVLDVASGAWSEGPSLPSGPLKGFGASACASEGRLYASTLSGVVWRLAGNGQAWEEVGRLNRPRFFHRLVPGGPGRLLAVGGTSRQGKFDDVEIVTVAGKVAFDWPGFRGPHRDGITSESVPPPNWQEEEPQVLWRRSLGRGLSSFAVSQGRVFTLGNQDNQDTVWCLDAASGEVVWQYDYACASTNHPMPIVPYGPAATPQLAEGRVFTLSREGHLHCLDAQEGRLIWKRDLVGDLGGKRPVYGYAGSPLVAGGNVFLDVGGDGGSTVALHAATGEVCWQSGDGEAGYSSPRLVPWEGGVALAMFKGEAFTLLDPAGGGILGAHAITARDFCNTITPALAGSDVFVSNTGKEGTLRLDCRAGAPEVKWQRSELGLLFNSPVLWKGRLYGFNDANRSGNEFLCLDAASGEVVWRSEEVEKGVFIIADGMMIAMTRQSELVLARLGEDGIEVAGRAQVLGGKSWVDPVLVEGRLFIRNNDGEAACLGLAAPSG